MWLIVAENAKILDDKRKLKILSEKKFTTDLEKQWLRQKLLEYKVKKGDLEEFDKNGYDPYHLLAAAKESGCNQVRT